MKGKGREAARNALIELVHVRTGTSPWALSMQLKLWNGMLCGINSFRCIKYLKIFLLFSLLEECCRLWTLWVSSIISQSIWWPMAVILLINLFYFIFYNKKNDDLRQWQKDTPLENFFFFFWRKMLQGWIIPILDP